MSRKRRRGNDGGGSNIVRIGPKKRDRFKYLTPLERLKLGVDCARGSELKYYPNSDDVKAAKWVNDWSNDVSMWSVESTYEDGAGSGLGTDERGSKKPSKTKYCYLMKRETTSQIGIKEVIYKIGQSCDPKHRCKNLNTTPETKVELVLYSDLVKEKHMHAVFKKNRIPHKTLREWFKFTKSELDLCIKIMEGDFDKNMLFKLIKPNPNIYGNRGASDIYAMIEYRNAQLNKKQTNKANEEGFNFSNFK